MEAWIEVNLVPVHLMDQDLLVDLVDPLVHEELGEEIETWFFFWEPELRLRIRWREPERAETIARPPYDPDDPYEESTCSSG